MTLINPLKNHNGNHKTAFLPPPLSSTTHPLQQQQPSHQQPLQQQNHFSQQCPSLPQQPQQMRNNNPSKKHFYRCSACHKDIMEQFILKVAPNLDFHSQCLRCAECHQLLHENSTCFVRHERIYCKRDYQKLFPTRCRLCQLEFLENDLVMKARNNIYHTDCFKCVVCNRVLSSGDEFCIREKGIYCKGDFELADKTTEDVNNNVIEACKNTPPLLTTLSEDIKDNCDDACVLTSNGSSESDSSVKTTAGKSRSESRSRSHKSDHKATRVRTVLNEKQLYTLRTCYGANPRPDALMKEQLVEMTGLSPRVIRVWFQNKRCKDKKRTILLKQIQQQQQEKGDSCDIDETMWLKSKGGTMLSYSPDPQAWMPGLNLFHWKNLMEDEPANQQQQQQMLQQQHEQQHLSYLHNTYQNMLSQQHNINNENDNSNKANDDNCDDDDDAIVCLKEPTHLMTSLDFHDDVTIT